MGRVRAGTRHLAEHRRTERENNTEQALNQSSSLFAERRDGLKSGVEGLLPMGTQYRVGVTWDRIANNLTRTTTADRWEDEYQEPSPASA